MKPNLAPDPSMEQLLASIRQSITDISAEGVRTAAMPAATPSAKGPRVVPASDSAEPHADPRGSEGTAGPERVVELRPRQDEQPASLPPQAEATATREDGAAAMRSRPSFGSTLRRVSATAAAQTLPQDPPPAVKAVARANPANESRRAPEQPVERAGKPAPIMSAETDATVSRAFNQLAETLFPGESQSLEDIVRETLRPMLKSWLDSNLPPLVERLVREEIERVARGQRHG